MDEIDYKIKIRTFYDSYEEYEDSEFILPIPTHIMNVEGFMNYFCNTTKRKGQMIQILEYEECR